MRFKKLRRLSGKNRDFVIIACSILLGAATQFLYTHIWQIGNRFLGMLVNLFTQTSNELLLQSLGLYWKVSWMGIVIEMIFTIIVILALLFWARIGEDNDKEIKGLRSDIKIMKDDLVNKLDTLPDRIAKAMKEANNEDNE